MGPLIMAKIIKNYRIEQTLDERFENVTKAIGISRTSVLTEAIINFVNKYEEEMKMKNLEELQSVITDERVKLSESKGVYYADVVEENGDEDRLAQNTNLEKLHEILKSYGVAE